MDNQQVKSEFDIGWVTGIIDGEGWMILNHQTLPSRNPRYVPVVGIGCTSKAMLDRVEEICHKWNVGTWRCERKLHHPIWKDQFIINIRGFARVGKLLAIIGQHLVVKPRQAKLLQEYIAYRSTKTVHDPCGNVEKSFYEQLKALNRKGKTSTTK